MLEWEAHKNIFEKIIKVKLLLTDNDGVLTDGTALYSKHGEEMKRYSLRDGMGIERLREILGMETGIITKESSQIILSRAQKLKLKHVYAGINDKLTKLKEILEQENLLPENIAYIGDDVNDLEVLEFVGFSASPADGMEQVKMLVDYVTTRRGGDGALRELIELILFVHRAQGNNG